MNRRLLSFVLVAACVDPVHDEEVEALGPEVSGVNEGPLHRAGQPCIVCHGEHGPAEPELSVAGTLYVARGRDEAAPNAVVTVIDARNKAYELQANAAGNFYVTKEEYDPVYPLTVEVARENGAKVFPMSTLIRERGDCGSCHRGGGDGTHVPRVYVSEGP